MADEGRNSYHTATVALNVNGVVRQVDVRHHWTLLDALREQLDLTGSKRGCDRGECGSCTVLLEGKPVYSCQLLALQVGSRPVVTIEGLEQDGAAGPADGCSRLSWKTTAASAVSVRRGSLWRPRHCWRPTRRPPKGKSGRPWAGTCAAATPTGGFWRRSGRRWRDRLFDQPNPGNLRRRYHDYPGGTPA